MSGEHPEGGFLVPRELREALFETVRENLAAMDAWEARAFAALPPVPWHRKARNRWLGLRERAARRAFRIIAGYEAGTD